MVGDFDFPAGKFSGPIYGMNKFEWENFASPFDKAIVVMRDPRDRLISSLFSILNSHGTDHFIRLGRELLASFSEDRLRIIWMILQASQFKRFYETWNASSGPNVLIVRYEDLINDTANEFKKIFSFLERDIPLVVLESVVERNSFERRSGRERGEESKFNHHRKGVAKDWEKYFTLEHGKLWETLYPGFLKDIGYESRNDWWKELSKSATLLQSPQFSLSEVMEKRNEFLECEILAKENEIKRLVDICEERLDLIKLLDSELKKGKYVSGS